MAADDCAPASLDALEDRGWSAENLAFGMGAGLLQKVNRDTLRFAMKANARQDKDGAWHGIHKAPKTDPGKASKRFRQAVVMEGGEPVAVPLKDMGSRKNLLETVWENGELKLYLTALTRLLICKGTIEHEELARLVRVIDQSDGEEDGQFTGEVGT